MKRNILYVVFMSILWSGFCWGVEPPLKLKNSLNFALEYGPPVGAFSSRHSPSVLILERGRSYWLFDSKFHGMHHLAKSDSSGPDGLVYGAYWDNDGPMLFYYDKQVVKRFNPKMPEQPEVISADIGGVSLRTSAWFEDVGVLIDSVHPYIYDERKLVAKEKHQTRKHHLPRQSGLVLLNDSQYVTSGYEDQTVRVWSLPKGELVKEWVLGKWYSSRKINHIAVVHGRLLVASAGGRIEERSLETGEVLWSTRPCRGGAASFQYSSHYRNMGNEFSRPTQSINTDGEVHYICGKKFGTIWRHEDGWHHESLGEIADLLGNLVTIETLFDTSLVVLVVENGNVHVLDRQQRKIVQTLHQVEERNVNAVTYIPATRQLLVVGVSGAIHLYELLVGPS